MVEMILGIPCLGLGLCHIGSPWILNGYGQPLRDVDGYHVDPTKDETVKWYRIDYLKEEAKALLNDRLVKIRNERDKEDKQLTLF